MFTLKKQKKTHPIAYIEGGNFPCRYLRINEGFNEKDQMERDLKLPASQIVSEDEMRSNYRGTKKNLVTKDINMIYKYLSQGNSSPDLPSHLISLYNKMLPLYKQRVNRSVHLDDSKVYPVFNNSKSMNNRMIIYGNSGSGKSFLANILAQLYHKMNPRNNIILFSAIGEDTSINDRIIKRFVIDDEIVDDPVEIDELQDTLVIMDDIECLPKKQRAAIFDLINKILTTGRHTNTDLIFCTHSITNGKETKYLLEELTDFIFYPHSNKYQSTRVCKEYLGIPPTEIKKIMSLPSRWVCVHRGFQPYVLYNQGVIGL